MSTKKWRLCLTPLNGMTPLRELDVEASNWMGALRAGREELGEEGGIPAGASCAVAPDGTVTVLDAAARRKFVLTPNDGSLPPPAAAPVPSAPQASAQSPAAQAPAPSSGKKKFQTVAYTPGMPLPGMPTSGAQNAAAAPQPAPVAQPAPAPAPVIAAPAQPPSAADAPAKKKKFETVAFSPDQAKAMMHEQQVVAVSGAASAQPASARPAPAPQAAAVPAQAAPVPQAATGVSSAPPTPAAASGSFELLLQRDEQPTKENPLTYRERAYLVPPGMRVSDAESALRFVLAEIRAQVESAPRGKLVTLAAFDHRWTDAPERPPLVVVQWRDWRGDPVVDYPAAVRTSLPPADPNDVDERMAIMFEAVNDLGHKRTAVDALELVLSALQQTVPCVAMSACLYDINTDELRFVVLTGPGARERQGQAIARNAGLIGQATRAEHSLVVPDLRVQPLYAPATDGRVGLEPTNMLLRAATHEGQLLGVLQLVDRQAGVFTAGDVHVVNYAADHLGAFLSSIRALPIK